MSIKTRNDEWIIIHTDESLNICRLYRRVICKKNMNTCVKWKVSYENKSTITEHSNHNNSTRKISKKERKKHIKNTPGESTNII